MQPANTICPACLASEMDVFYEKEGLPANGTAVLASSDLALNATRGDLRLGFCRRCGFIANLAYDARKSGVSQPWLNGHSCSPSFDHFMRKLADLLVDGYRLRGKRILDMSSGTGEFLSLLCQLGDNQGIGFDRQVSAGRIAAELKDRVQFIEDVYSDRYADLEADLVLCRMVLDHTPRPDSLLRMLRQVFENRPMTVFMFQIPDVTRSLRQLAFWSFPYERCSHYSPASVIRLAQHSGFYLTGLSREYGGQYLVLYARQAYNGSQTGFDWEVKSSTLAQGVQYFADHIQGRLETWKTYLQSLKDQGQRVVLWGPSSQGAVFLSTLDIREEIEFFVDFNASRHGAYLPVTGQPIVPPEFMIEYCPETVLLLNPEDRQEVAQALDEMGLEAQILVANEMDW